MRYPTLLVLLTACNASSAVQVPAPEPALEVVVANQQSASASLLMTDGTMRHIVVGNGPHEAAVSPDGRWGVVTIYGAKQAGNQLAVIDLARDSVVRTIDLGMYTRPHGAVFLGGSSSRVAVTSESTGFVVLVDIAAGAIEAAVPTDARASHMVAVTADGRRAFTANIVDDNVSEMDLVAKTFVRKFPVPARPEGIAVTPDGAEVWVGSNQTGAVSVINTATGDVAHTLTGVAFPYRLTASHAGKLVAIVDGKGNRLFMASVANHQMIGAVPLEQPRGVAFSPDDKQAFVTLGGGQLAVIDVATLNLVRTVPVQASPDGVGVGVRR